MDPLDAACRAVFRQPAKTVTPLHGGDLSMVSRVTLSDGPAVVAKRGPLVAREARMLSAISATGMPTPRVLGVSAGVMFLESLDETRAQAGHWPRFGEALARMHAHGPKGAGYGWPEDYAFGPVDIPNATTDNWPAFWAEQRLLPALPHLPAHLAGRVERLAARLGDLLPSRPTPGLLHGDLWSGNLLPTTSAIHLIDPACYRGHGEVDLAMLHLFATPGPGFWDGYGAPDPGWETRRAVYALFPALVHVRLFGAGYHAMAEGFLTAAGV